MKQQINLYLPEFRVRKDPVNAVLMGQILGGIVLVLALLSAYSLVQRWQLENQLEGLRTELADASQQTRQLNEQLSRRSQNQSLQQRLELAEQTLSSNRQIRDFLSQTQLGNITGFSDYLKDLSRAAMAGLSIEQFAISNGGAAVRVSGQVINSELVPRYVFNLQDGGSGLRNLRFNPSISRPSPTERTFAFSLSTNANE